MDGMYNNRMHTDSKKHRSLVALLLSAGDAKRYASKESKCVTN